MFAKLKGIIDTVDEDSVILDVGGVGYHIFCSGKTLASMGAAGEAAQLIIETHVREDHIHLYGFREAAERDWFRALLTVQRVGAKMALGILSAYGPAQLSEILFAKDQRALSKVSGVGPKLAERIVAELKDKAVKLASSGTVVAFPGNAGKATSEYEDAISALTHLGYGRSEAYGAIAKASQKEKDASLDQLIKLSLKELAR